MKKPYIIAVNAVSGGGKTAVTKTLCKSLEKSKAFFFDEFDATNRYPDDYYEWSMRKGSIEEFDCPGMQEAVLEAMSTDAFKYIIMDFPFGRDHHRFKEMIDLSIFIDTPLDVAMARRIVRDFIESRTESAESTLEKLKEDLSHYVAKARYPYLDTYTHRAECDLILDGWQSLESLKEQIIAKILLEQGAIGEGDAAT